MQRRLFRPAVVLAAGLLVLLLALWAGDRAFPLNPAPVLSTLVLASDGTPLRAFPGSDSTWRYPVTQADVSPQMLEMLLAYEDRWFYVHPGVNPLALLRALGQNLLSGRRVSGGSTLTMQVARLLHPDSRGYLGKLRQMARALQLEYHYSKAQIINLYLNLAPYGGMLSGVQAASFFYFGKPARELSDAEAALLVVLPQRPSVYRPDRDPTKARQMRDKVLTRMEQLGFWGSERVTEAQQEPVLLAGEGVPRVAPLLARRLYQNCSRCEVIHTTLDYDLQVQLEHLAAQYKRQLAAQQSLAIMVMDNTAARVVAYVGSADFNDTASQGQVDMVQAVRSPGSTLKPFLYGMALDAGLIHSQSLLQDAPRYSSRYRPRNFTGQFNGPVSAEEALQRSLNVPAVQLLEHFGSEKFLARLQHAGLKTFGPGSRHPNTSIILGGIGVRMQEMVGLYSALARQGQASEPALLPDQPSVSRYLLSPGAAWIVRDMLTQHPNRRLGVKGGSHWNLAWKTGTSYGYREAWAFGVSPRWTIGVWVGRPDGSASPGQYGRATAAPLLFRVHGALDDRQPLPAHPASVTAMPICWPLGTAKSRTENHAGNCMRTLDAWVLQNTAPATLAETPDISLQPLLKTYWLTTAGQRAEPVCAAGQALHRAALAQWPLSLQPWLPGNWQLESRQPAPLPACHLLEQERQRIKITTWPDNALVRAPRVRQGLMVDLQAEGGSGLREWYLNGAFIGQSPPGVALPYRLTTPGEHQFAVVDEQGNSDLVHIRYQPVSQLNSSG